MKYSDEELHKMHDEAKKRGDDGLAVAILVLAAARGANRENELNNLHVMFMGYLAANEKTGFDNKKGENHEIRDIDLTSLDPDMVVQF